MKSAHHRSLRRIRLTLVVFTVLVSAGVAYAIHRSIAMSRRHAHAVDLALEVKVRVAVAASFVTSAGEAEEARGDQAASALTAAEKLVGSLLDDRVLGGSSSLAREARRRVAALRAGLGRVREMLMGEEVPVAAKENDRLRATLGTLVDDADHVIQAVQAANAAELEGLRVWEFGLPAGTLFVGLIAITLTRFLMREHVEYERRIEEGKELLRTVINATQDAMIAIGEDGKVTLFNAAAEGMFGRAQEEMIGQPLDGLMPEWYRSRHNEYVRSYFQTGVPRGAVGRTLEVPGHRADGTEFPMEISLAAGKFGDRRFVIGVARDITKRVAAEEALRSERDFMSAVLNTAGALVVVLDRKGRIVRFNRACEQVTGYSFEEVRDKEFFDLFLIPEEMAEVRDVFERLRDGDFPNTHENYLITRDGRRRLISWSNTALVGDDGNVEHVIATGLDMTERRQVEDQLRSSEQRFRLLAENVPGVIYLCKNDARYTMLYLNDGVEDLTGYSKEDFLSDRISFTELYHPDDVEGVYRNVDQALAQHRPFRLIYRMRHKNGDWQWLDESGTGVWDDNTGELLFLEGFISDITDRKRAEHERRTLEARIQHAQKLESLGILAGGIAHDFNNLLVGILGNVGLAQIEVGQNGRVRQIIDQIELAGQRAADLARQMLAYSGKGRFAVEPFDLSSLVEEMAHLLEVSMSKKAVLRFELARETPPVVADATQVRQVVMNLITNASDALEGRSGIVVVRTGVMQADRAYLADSYLDEELPEGYYAYVEVEDTGCGMDQATVAKIFDPFFTTKFTGRGLGLAAVLGIVRGHQGALRVQSEPGKGTIFRVLFPCGSISEAKGGDDTGDQAMNAKQWHTTGTVLVADDEEIVRTVAKMALENCGLSVLTAVDGEATVDVFREHADELALVILDMTMPRLSGEEVYRELRSIKPNARIVISSGYNEQDVVDTFAEDKPAGFIQKPYRAQDLVDKVREILED